MYTHRGISFVIYESNVFHGVRSVLIGAYFFFFNEWLELTVVLWRLKRMEGVGGDSVGGAAAPVNQFWQDVWRRYQYFLDKSTPHTVYRWIGTVVIVLIYILRVYYVQGFYIISYGLGIYLLNLLIGFLSPLVDPEMEVSAGPLLPTKGSDEFKPFIRRLPEFKFW